MSQILLLSDLHLSAHTSSFNQIFIKNLAEWKTQYDELYLLGDIFDIWLGDDIIDDYTLQIINALADFAKYKPIYFIPGNRDFLIGDQFLSLIGASQLPDPCLKFFNGYPYILSHGDLLCTDDLAYQKFRRKTHNKEWQKNILTKPKWLRRAIGLVLRFVSKKKGKYTNNIDVSHTGINTFKTQFADYPSATIIHGHTHKPAKHTEIFEYAGQKYNFLRIVLPDWRTDIHGAIKIDDQNNLEFLYF